MRLQRLFSNFYLIEDIIPLSKKMFSIIKSFFIGLNKILNNFYFLEDIVPALKKTGVLSKTLWEHCKIIYAKLKLKKNEFVIFASSYLKYRRMYKERIQNSDGINVEKYATVSRMRHEAKYGITNTDYNALVIDWTLLAQARKKRMEMKQVNERFKTKSIKSTYSYELNQRIVY